MLYENLRQASAGSDAKALRDILKEILMFVCFDNIELKVICHAVLSVVSSAEIFFLHQQ